MLQVIDPSVADEDDPFSIDARTRHVPPRQRLAAVARAVLVRPRVGRDATGRRSSPGSPASTRSPRRRSPTPQAVLPLLTAHRSERRSGRLARARGGARCSPGTSPSTARSPIPAYLDLSIDPDERPLGSLFAFPDPLDANYGRGGLARTMTARGWLSARGRVCRATPSWPTRCPQVTVPTLLVHPTADTEIRGVAGQGDRRRRRRRRRHLRRDEGRPPLPRGPPARGAGDRRRLARGSAIRSRSCR